MKLKDLDFRIIGIIFLAIGVCIFIYGDRENTVMMVCMAVVMIGLIISILGVVKMMLDDRQKAKLLERDIEVVIQPLVTKYSKINKELIRTQSKDDMEIYIAQRKRMNQEMEEVLTRELPYLTNRDIKKIIIEFNKNQDSL